MTGWNGHPVPEEADAGTADMVLIERETTILLCVGVPKEGTFDEEDAERARAVFEFALGIRMRMGGSS